MSSITAALRTAQSGLLVNQSALNATANNITNVNTPGYSRQIVQFQQRVVAGVGAGVEIGDIIRSVDEGLLKSVRLELSQTSTLSSQATFYDRVQDLFGEPEDNNSISHIMAEFAASLEALATTPESTLEMSDVVRQAENITNRLQDMTETIQELRVQADRSISEGVDEINKLINDINQLNNDIVANSTSNRGTTDLRDLRDKALDRLSELMDIRFFLRSDGDVVIFTSSGRTLLDNLPVTLTHSPASTLSATSTHAEGDISGIFAGDKIAANDLTDVLREGTLHGLVTIRDSVLTNLQSQLDEFAAELRDAVNQIHNRGMPFPGLTQMTGTRQFIDTATQTIKLDPANGADDVKIALLDNSGDQSAVTTLNTIMVAATFSDRGSGDDWTIDAVAATMQTWLQANGAATATVDVSTGQMVINLNSTTLNLSFRDQTGSTNGDTAEDAVISFDVNGDGVEDESVNGFSNFFALNDFFIDNRVDNLFESNVLVSSFTVSAATLTFTDSTGALDVNGAPGSLAVAAGTTLQDLAIQITNSVENV
ncbi:MAG: flagellar hook-associated protein FlgK, partial [Alphaproteobacteria bacterium]|nr:flagellar hook-associated protein FlgK [Alphaproteobacteria bacterium]